MSDRRSITTRITPVPDRRWTQSDITQLRTMVASGATADDVAHKLDRSLADVIALINRLRLRTL